MPDGVMQDERAIVSRREQLVTVAHETRELRKGARGVEVGAQPPCPEEALQLETVVGGRVAVGDRGMELVDAVHAASASSHRGATRSHAKSATLRAPAASQNPPTQDHFPPDIRRLILC